MKAFFALAPIALVSACTVEPPDLPPLDASLPDAQPFLDAGRGDAGTDAGNAACTRDDECAAGEYCAADQCRKRPVHCTSTDECAFPDRCARPLVATSSIDAGLCTGLSRLRAVCASDAECGANEICTAAGYCVTAAVAVAGNLESTCLDADECGPGETAAAARTIALVASCREGTDCGPAGLCDATRGACTTCTTNADCPRQLACQDGACEERPTCSTDQHCFPDNQCMSQRCVRRSSCRTDGGDTIANAVRLQAAYYQELGLCDDRGVSWWAFDIAGREGARIALTSTRSAATLVMDLFDEAGQVVSDARWLTLPGLTVVEVTPPGRDLTTGATLDRKLRLRIESLDQAGHYDLDLQRITPLCPGDALDQYGDREASRALPVDGNRTYLATACPEDEDFLAIDSAPDDQILIGASYDPDTHANLDLFAYAGSATLAAGRSTDTSSESLDTGRLASGGRLALRTSAVLAPSGGVDYLLDITARLGTFFRACRDATDLPLVGGSATVQGDLAAAVDLGAPRCDPDLYAATRRHDLLYRIKPASAPSLLRALITPAPGSASEVTAAVVSGCATDDAITRYCDSAELPRRALQVELPLDDASPVYLLVSSDGPSEDSSFTLDVEVEPVTLPPNDSCAAAIEIAASGDLEVSTYGATNTVEATGFGCGLFDDDAQGRDAFYRLRLDGGQRAAFELSGPRGGLLWIATDCGQMTATCTTAQAISYVDPVAKAALSPANPTTYFIDVDGLDADDRGIYDLRTVLDPQCLSNRDCAGNLRCDDYLCVPVPANDTCAGAAPIVLDAEGRATIVASTGAANDTISPSCLGESDRDVVYRIDLPLDRSSLTARIVDARFDPALAIRHAQCEASLEEVCNDDVRFGEILLPEVTWVQPAAGTYYVIVDAYAGSGTFTLEIEALP